MKRDLVRRVQESWVENVPGSKKWIHIFEIAKHSARISQVNRYNGTILKEFKMKHE